MRGYLGRSFVGVKRFFRFGEIGEQKGFGVFGNWEKWGDFGIGLGWIGIE